MLIYLLNNFNYFNINLLFKRKITIYLNDTYWQPPLDQPKGHRRKDQPGDRLLSFCTLRVPSNNSPNRCRSEITKSSLVLLKNEYYIDKYINVYIKENLQIHLFKHLIKNRSNYFLQNVFPLRYNYVLTCANVQYKVLRSARREEKLSRNALKNYTNNCLYCQQADFFVKQPTCRDTDSNAKKSSHARYLLDVLRLLLYK